MNKFLLDSSVIIDALNNKKQRYELLRGLIVAGDNLGCCCISITEVYAGLRESELDKTIKFFAELEYYEVNPRIAEYAGVVIGEYRKKGIALDLPDATIASVAMANGCILITDNVKDFPMPELKLYKIPKI